MNDDEDDVFLKRLETSLLATLSLQGIEGIQRVYMSDKEKRPSINAEGEIVSVCLCPRASVNVRAMVLSLSLNEPL